MYHKGIIAAGTGAGLSTLPHTGLELIWFIIAGFALLMAAGALWRTIPRRQG
jgi:LPXTG-motif cell wall-anchored protein